MNSITRTVLVLTTDAGLSAQVAAQASNIFAMEAKLTALFLLKHPAMKTVNVNLAMSDG